MLSFTQIREMLRCGIEFGAHTVTHRDLRQLPEEEIEQEIVGSKQLIEDRLGTRVAAFAYPFGRFDDLSLKVVRRHFRCAFSDALGLLMPGNNRFALPRLDTHYFRSGRWVWLGRRRALHRYVALHSALRWLRRQLLRDRR